MITSRSLAIFVTALAVFTVSAAGQDSLPQGTTGATSTVPTARVASSVAPFLRPGDRVRVWVAGARHDGLLDDVQPDLVLLRGQLPFARARIQRIDVAVRRGHAREGLIIGSLVGLLLGSQAAKSWDNGGLCCEGLGEALAIWFGVTAATGAAGGVVGGAIKTDDWQPVFFFPPPSDHSLVRPWLGSAPVTVLLRIPIRLSL